jgi:hypothetical protein
MIIIPATDSGSAKIIVKTCSPRAAPAEITWAQGRQAGDPALEAAVLRGPANGDRAIDGLRTAVPYPHHAASYISLCNQPSFRQPRNIRRSARLVGAILAAESSADRANLLAVPGMQ